MPQLKRIIILVVFAIEAAAQGNRILPTYTVTQNPVDSIGRQVPQRMLFAIMNSNAYSAQSLEAGDTFRVVFQFSEGQPVELSGMIMTSVSALAGNFEVLRGEFPSDVLLRYNGAPAAFGPGDAISFEIRVNQPTRTGVGRLLVRRPMSE